VIYRNANDFNTPNQIIPILEESIQKEMNTQLIHYGGCRDGFESSGYLYGGAFNMALCHVWANGVFERTISNY